MVNGVSKEKYYRVNLYGKNGYKAKQEEEINIFASLLSSDSTYKFDEYKTYYCDNYKTPREEFEKFMKEQGIIGQITDKLKNKNAFLSFLGYKGSYAIELVLYKYENDYILEYEAREAVRKYIKEQKQAIEFILSLLMIIFIIISFGLLKICEAETGIALSCSLLTGGFIKLAGKKLELLTSNLSKSKTKQKNIMQSNNIFNAESIKNACYTL